MADLKTVVRRILVVAYLLAVHAALIYLLVDKFVAENLRTGHVSPAAVPAPSTGPHIEPAEFPSATPEPLPQPASTIAPVEPLAPNELLIPVAGVRPEQLMDTFTDSRSAGRTHDAIDIPAAAGTPVLAAADGEILKFHDSELGGTTIYQISRDKKFFFYYAHLRSRAPGIAEKQFVTRGTTIGYVGDTGNAGAGNYHLHFSISAVVDPTRYWDGININPYPILKGETRLQ